MKRNLLAATIAIGILTLVGCDKEKETEPNAVNQNAGQTVQDGAAEQSDTPELSTSVQRVSYIVGMDMGQKLLREGMADLELDMAALNLGIQDMLSGQEMRIEEQDIIAAFGEMQTRLEEQASVAYQASQKVNAEYLTENGAREGVITTESGLQYEVVESGEAAGAQPKATDTVSVHYEGKLVDGTVFDSSIQRGEPIDLPVNQVIPGWVEALQLMRVGDKWKVTVPSDLAYGQASPSPLIPPNSVLVFDMELLGIKDTE